MLAGDVVDNGTAKKAQAVLHFLGHRMSTADGVVGSALQSLRLHASGSSGNLLRHVGAGVGETVGLIVGGRDVVGETLGMFDGDDVDKVGAAEGLAVRLIVGPAVGRAVGGIVGLAVGLTKKMQAVLHFLGHRMSTADGVVGSVAQTQLLHASGSSRNLPRHVGAGVGDTLGMLVPWKRSQQVRPQRPKKRESALPQLVESHSEWALSL